MKILWLSNCALREDDISASGSWIQALADVLIPNKAVQLGIIAFADQDHFSRQDYRGTPQWLVPKFAKVGTNGLPCKALIEQVIDACKSFNPDIIHVWGVEGYWGLLTARGYISVPVVLEMQGLKSTCARVYTADLTLFEQFKCTGLKEVIKRKWLGSYKKDFADWGRFEIEMLKSHQYIDVQSAWMSAQVTAINQKATQFMVDLVLRPPFYSAAPWKDFDHQRTHEIKNYSIFFSASGTYPYKGAHVAIRALAILKREFPDIRLRICGHLNSNGFFQNGYARWIKIISKSLGVFDNIDWLGPLNANEIILELQLCSASLVCSFVESYCLALAEPLYLGVPCVTSYCGGTAWVATSEHSALFYPPGDEAMCAHQLRRILTCSNTKRTLSENARHDALLRHDQQTNGRRTIINYQKTINDIKK